MWFLKKLCHVGHVKPICNGYDDGDGMASKADAIHLVNDTPTLRWSLYTYKLRKIVSPLGLQDETYPAKTTEAWGYCMLKIA